MLFHLIFLFSHNTLFTVRSLILIIVIYCTTIFLITKNILSFLCFLIYISGILIFLTYMVIISSSFRKVQWSYFIFLGGICLILFFLITWYPNPLELAQRVILVLYVIKIDFIISILIILFVQLFLYFLILDFKSLRTY